MSWQGIEGHDAIVDQFRRSLAAGRLGSTFLFVGVAGIGKRMFAQKLAQSLLCEHAAEQPLDPCGACPSCAQVLAQTHPDLDIVSKPADRSFIPINLLIGDKQHRMREGLCARMALRPSSGNRKIGIIDDADYLNQEGANCLLKTLEEPPPGSVLILIGTSPQRQLPTIRSRSQIIRFDALSPDACTDLILRLGWAADSSEARQLAEMSGGSLASAALWNDAELWGFRESLLKELTQTDWDSVKLAQSIGEFVDAAGKEAPKRRARLRMIIETVLQYYAQAMRHSVGHEISGDSELRTQVARLVGFQHLSAESLADCVERTQQARLQVDANANQATLIEAWIDDLAELNLGNGIPHPIAW